MSDEWRLRLEPVFKPLMRAYWRLSRPMTLGVRGLACDEAGRVLLVRHSYTPGWHFPGGGVERGETIAAAIAREMAEEGGVALEGAPLLIGIYANRAFPNDHVALFRITAWRACAPRENGEIRERAFFAPDAPPESATPGTRRRLAELYQGAPISSDW